SVDPEPTGFRSADLDQVDDEDQGLPRLDHIAGAAVAVGQVRRDGELAAAADPHPQDALVPAGDDLADAELEAERLAPAPGGVELLPRGVRDPDVVHGEAGAVHGLLALADGDVLDLQLGRRRAVDEVDLGTFERHLFVLPRSGSGQRCTSVSAPRGLRCPPSPRPRRPAPPPPRPRCAPARRPTPRGAAPPGRRTPRSARPPPPGRAPPRAPRRAARPPPAPAPAPTARSPPPRGGTRAAPAPAPAGCRGWAAPRSRPPRAARARRRACRSGRPAARCPSWPSPPPRCRAGRRGRCRPAGRAPRRAAG